MAEYNVKRNGIHFKIEISWKPATFTEKARWFIRLNYIDPKDTKYKMIISEMKDNVIAKNNMKKFLQNNDVKTLPEFEDYERAKELFFKQDVKNTDLPQHIKEYTR